jgi:hypothetical protein
MWPIGRRTAPCRALAVRGFDASGMMTGWEIVEGTNVEAAIKRQFANAQAEYLHIHFCRARVLRSTGRPRRVSGQRPLKSGHFSVLC